MGVVVYPSYPHCKELEAQGHPMLPINSNLAKNTATVPYIFNTSQSRIRPISEF